MSELTLIIGNKNYSSWSLRPWIYLQHHNIPFTEKRVALFTHTTDVELAEYNSDYKVPILQDGAVTIWDSLAILEYLAEKFPETAGWPAGSTQRALARSISAEIHSSFSHVRSEFPMNVRKTFQHILPSVAAEREIKRITSLWNQCRSQYGSNGEWLFGHYTIADAMFAPIALRFAGYSIALDTISATYVQNVINHPCIQAWIDDGRLEKEIIAEDELEDA